MVIFRVSIWFLCDENEEHERTSFHWRHAQECTTSSDLLTDNVTLIYNRSSTLSYFVHHHSLRPLLCTSRPVGKITSICASIIALTIYPDHGSKLRTGSSTHDHHGRE